MTAAELPEVAGPGASRRTFLTGAGLTGLAVGAGVLAAPDADAAAASPGTCALDFDGAKGGVPARATGGLLYGTVTSQPRAGSEIRSKRIVDVVVSPVSVTCGTGMSRAFYTALNSFSTGGTSTHSGRITRRDSAGKAFHHTEIYNAVVTSLQLPAVEIGAKAAAHMVVGLYVQNAGSGTAGAVQKPVTRSPWLTGNFVFTIPRTDRLPAITTRVAKVGAMTLKRNVLESQFPGDDVDFDDLEVSDLVVSFAGNNPADLAAWFQDYLIAGNRINANRTGKLSYLGADGKPLFSLTLGGLGLCQLVPATSIVGTEKVVRTTATMFCESATFNASSTADL